jgi:hypothetical protein
MRTLAAPIVVARPTGARIRTRLRLTPADAAVVGAVGEHLGRLSGADLAWRRRLGHASGPGGDRRTDRKRALTAPSSSRWAGAITRTSNDQWERAYHNLLDTRAGLRSARNKLWARLAIPAGQIRRSGRHPLRGYQSQSERFEKQRRLQHLQARLAQIEEQIAHGRVSVCRGSRRLAKLRQAIDAGNATCRLTEVEWRSRWEAARLFITADGEASKRWGNETIRVHPDEGWLELRLPNPLAYLSNTPGRAATYRLACPVRFTHRVGEWAAQATGGAVRYDIWLDPAKGAGRWYLDASWRTPAEVPPSLGALRTHRAVAIDLNADHLAGVVVSPSGSPIGAPQTIPLDLDDLPATTRDGRLRAAVSTIIMLAKQGGCRAIIIEDLNFADARQTGPGTPRPRRSRQAVPPHRQRHPDPRVPGSAGPHGRQRRSVGDRGGCWLDIQMGAALLAGAPGQRVQTIGHGDAASCRGGSDRQTRPWVWCPAAVRCDPTPPADGRRRAAGQAGCWALGREGTRPPGGQRAADQFV